MVIYIFSIDSSDDQNIIMDTSPTSSIGNKWNFSFDCFFNIVMCYFFTERSPKIFDVNSINSSKKRLQFESASLHSTTLNEPLADEGIIMFN